MNRIIPPNTDFQGVLSALGACNEGRAWVWDRSFRWMWENSGPGSYCPYNTYRRWLVNRLISRGYWCADEPKSVHAALVKYWRDHVCGREVEREFGRRTFRLVRRVGTWETLNYPPELLEISEDGGRTWQPA